MIGKRTFRPNKVAVEYIADILDSGRVSYGKYSKNLEGQFSAMMGMKYGVLSNSGTSSLQVALQTLKELHNWPDGAEVIVPSVTFVATINVILHNKLRPVLVDVDPLTYNIDPALISYAMTQQTVAIMPVHLFGLMVDMKRTKKAINFWNPDIKILTDSCEAMLASQGGEGVSYLSDITCFSFYMAHHIQAGVGGIAITNSHEYAKKMRSLVNHGMVCDTLDGLTFDPNRDFIFDSVGHSFRITEFEAALALSQLPYLPDNISKRQEIATKLTGMLSNLSKYLQLPHIPDGYNHSFMMYPIVLRNTTENGYNKAGLREHLARHQVGTRDMLPLVSQPVYKGRWNPDSYPVARWLDQNGLYLGLHNSMETEDLKHIAEAFYKYFDGGRLRHG